MIAERCSLKMFILMFRLCVCRHEPSSTFLFVSDFEKIRTVSPNHQYTFEHEKSCNFVRVKHRIMIHMGIS